MGNWDHRASRYELDWNNRASRYELERRRRRRIADGRLPLQMDDCRLSLGQYHPR
jgi:hypothetical protein